MILAIRTDTPTCEVWCDDTQYTWEAGRGLAKGLLAFVEENLTKHEATWKDLTGIIVYAGPGSFTGLRIGATVANTVAYAQSLPIVGTAGESWREDGMSRLNRDESDTTVVPAYGRDARITQPRR